MASDNRLDRLFRDKLEERKLSFDPSFWEAAEGLIAAEERKRRKRGFVWCLIGIATVLLTGFGIWCLSKGSGSGIHNPRALPAAPEERRTEQPVAALQKQAEEPHGEPVAAGSTVRGNHTASYRERPKGSSFVHSSVSGEQIRPSTLLSAGSGNTAIAGRGAGAEERIAPEGATLPEKTSSRQAATSDQRIAPEGAALPENRRAFLSELDRIPSAGFAVRQRAPGIVMDKTGVSLKARLSQEVHLGAVWSAASGVLPGFTGGVGASLFLRPHWGIGFGLGYYQEPTGGNTVIREASAVEYGFGRRETRYTLRPQTLHFLESPLLFFSLKARHRIEAGVAGGYLLGARGKLLAASAGQLDTIPSVQALESGWLETKGTASWQLHLMAGYRYRISPFLSLGTRIQYRASHLQINGDPRENRWRGQIQLTCHLVR